MQLGVKMAVRKRTLGLISDEILEKQKEIKRLNEQVDTAELQKKVLCEELMKAADDQKLEKGGGKASAFTIRPQTVPQVENWDLFYEFILKNKYLHLLQRRPGVQACAELWEQNKTIPGVEKFTQMKVTVKEA